MIEALKIVLLIAVVQKAFATPIGKRIGDYLPTPFWIYFLPMVLGSLGFLDLKATLGSSHQNVYDFLGKHILPLALVLMLIVTPVSSLFKLGGKATLAMALGTVTVAVGTFCSFMLLTRFLPVDGYKGAACLLATWTGGSANMLAVKEALRMPDTDLAPLVIVDTILSYAWMALLVFGVAFQKRFDGGSAKTFQVHAKTSDLPTKKGIWHKPWIQTMILITTTFLISEVMVVIGDLAEIHLPYLNARTWTLLITSGVCVILALTPLQKMESWGASQWGTFFLYVVLAGIGAKTSLQSARQAPIYLLYGGIVLLIHGVLLLIAGKALKIPLFLLATSSQANVGGPVSAPIVASVYQPGTSQFGVIMGIIGNIIGTYVGLFGAWVCLHLR